MPAAHAAPAAPLLTGAGIAAAISGVALANPFRHHLSPPCPFHALTGLWCPLCGGTRAVWAAAHGHVALMLHANALTPAIAAVALWAWAAWLGRTAGWWRLPVPRGRPVLISAAVLLVAFAVVRNLPGLAGLVPPRTA